MAPQVGDREQVTLTKARRCWHPLHPVSRPPPRRKRLKKTGVDVTPRLTLKRQVPTRNKTQGRCMTPSLPGRGRWPFSRPTPRFLYRRTVGGVSAGRLEPPSRPIPKLEDVLLCPVAGGGVGAVYGKQGHRKEVSRRSQKLRDPGCQPTGVCSLHLHLQHAMGTRASARTPGVESGGADAG